MAYAGPPPPNIIPIEGPPGIAAQADPQEPSRPPRLTVAPPTLSPPTNDANYRLSILELNFRQGSSLRYIRQHLDKLARELNVGVHEEMEWFLRILPIKLREHVIQTAPRTLEDIGRAITVYQNLYEPPTSIQSIESSTKVIFQGHAPPMFAEETENYPAAEFWRSFQLWSDFHRDIFNTDALKVASFQYCAKGSVLRWFRHIQPPANLQELKAIFMMNHTGTPIYRGPTSKATLKQEMKQRDA